MGNKSKRFFSAMTIVGYGLVAVFLIVAIAVTIMLSIYGFRKPEKKVNDLVFSAPTVSDDVNFSNNTLEVFTSETQKTIEFYVAGKQTGGESVDYSTRQIIVSINNSQTSFNPAKKDETSVWFAQKNSNGELVVDEKGNYVPVESNTITIKVNDPITLILATTQYPDDDLNEDKDAFYLKGGISHIHARSTDLLLEAQEMKVEVDVPVENFEIIVWGYDYNDTTGIKSNLTEQIKQTEGISYKRIRTYTNESDIPKNLTAEDALSKHTIYYNGEATTKYEKDCFYTVRETSESTYGFVKNEDLHYFIKGTELELGVRVFPSNATTALSSTGNFKNASYGLDRVSVGSAIILDGTNKLKIVGADDDTTGSITVVAKIPILLGKTEELSKTITIETARQEILKLEVLNSSIKDATLNCLVNAQMELRLKQDDSDVNALGINIVPKFYNGHDNPYKDDFSTIYAQILTNHSDADELPTGFIKVESLSHGFNMPITSIVEDSQSDGEKVVDKVLSFKAQRLLLQDEKAYLVISDQSRFEDETKPYYIFNLNPFVNEPATSELVYDQIVNSTVTKEDKNFIEKTQKSYSEDMLINGEKITTETIDIKMEYQEGTKPVIAPTESGQSEEFSLYTKWVYFVERAASTSGVDDDADGDKYSSDVILLSETGQIKSENNFGTSIFATGRGTIKIYPKLILCDSVGNPLNCFYEAFEVDDKTDYILMQNISSEILHSILAKLILDEKTTKDENNYVVLYEPSNAFITIDVSEQLTQVEFFYKDDFSPQEQLKTAAELVLSKSKTFYAIGNSIEALKISCINNKLSASLIKENAHVANAINYDYDSDGYIYFTIEDNNKGVGKYFLSIDNASTIIDEHGEEVDNISKVGEFTLLIKEVDIEQIHALFEETDIIKTYLLLEDVGKRILYTGENVSYTFGETVVDFKKNCYYVVKSKTEGEGTVLYWEEEESYSSFGINSSEKFINLVEQLEMKDEYNGIIFSNEIVLPNSVHYTLNIEKAHGNELEDVDGTKIVDYVVVLTNSKTNITTENLSLLTQSQKLKPVSVGGQLRIALFEGWKDEINGKYVYLVYTGSIQSMGVKTLRAVDYYKLNFNFDSANYEISKNESNLELKFNNTLITTKVSDSTEVTNFVSNLLSITGGSLNLDQSKIKVTFMSNPDSGDGEDYSRYVLVSLNTSGNITFSAAEGYKFSGDNETVPLATNGSYKLRVEFFNKIYLQETNAYYVVEIPVRLGFNVVEDV